MIKFIMKKKPLEPSRRVIRKAEELYDDTSIEELLTIISFVPEGAGGKLVHDSYWDECSGAQIVWKEPEPIEAFDKRYKDYKKKLAEWEEWAVKNKDKIKERVRLDVEKECKAKEKKIKEYEKDIAKKKKELKKLKS